MNDHIPDTNRDGKIDQRDYHSWMDATERNDSHGRFRMSDSTYLTVLFFLGLGAAAFVLYLLFH